MGEYERLLAGTKLKQLIANSQAFSGSMEDAESIAEELIESAGTVDVKLTKGTVELTFSLKDPAEHAAAEPVAPEL
jgi:hypothetical protein